MRYNIRKTIDKSKKVKLSELKIYSITLLMSFIFFASEISLAAGSDSPNQEIKNKIENLRNEIQRYQDEILEMGKQEKNLFDDITVLDKNIKKTELQLQETEFVILGLNADISKKQDAIDYMEREVYSQREILSSFLQELYEQSEISGIEMALGSETFSDYFSQSDNLESFEERTKEIHDGLMGAQDALEKEKEEILIRKEEFGNLRLMQKDQERYLESEKSRKNFLLSATKVEKENATLLMEKLQEELGALQALGEPISIDEAVKAAKYASELTNVAPEYLLGVLRIESGLGSNVGGGRYKTDMNPSQWETFKKICRELGIDPDKTPVSKRACYNRESKDGCGGWGGAMGPAQFMPSTWMGYKGRVEKTTGESPANPWDIRDSLVAMGLKLASVEGVTAGDRKAWSKAAGMYLAGGNWENYSWYSDRVLSYADGYKKIIK